MRSMKEGEEEGWTGEAALTDSVNSAILLLISFCRLRSATSFLVVRHLVVVGEVG